MTFWSHTDKTSAHQYHPGAVNVRYLNIAKGLVWKNAGNDTNNRQAKGAVFCVKWSAATST